jgi:imidazolonepropionase-like amidohydrolase
VMDVAFLNAMVFVGNDIVLERATVLVQGDRLVKVVQGEATVPRAIPRVDLAEHTLLPEFIDCHVHLCLGGGPDPASEARQASLPALTLHAADSARRTLMAGVTSVRDMGGIGYVELAVRDAVRAGVIVGPRVHASGRLICMTGGHGWLFGGRQADVWL